MRKRKECVFGLHFDFHAGPGQKGLGDNFRISDYEQMLREVQPDNLQVDTKGHPGLASYPTSVGNAADLYKTDMLIQIKTVCDKYEVPVFSHYSGVWDVFQCEKHPEYRAEFKGIVNKGETSVFSSYVDDVMIPQLKELAGKYKMNGVWVDGECWATQVDYSQSARDAFTKKYGREPDVENGKEEYEYFCRQAFFDYVKKYIDAVHSEYPDFEIASNWLETSFCPCDTGIDVDFISADYDPTDSVNTARFESRSLVNSRKHWELLAWGFNNQNGFYAIKSANQLKQELAAIYNLGGAANLYYTSLRNNIQMNAMPIWKELSAFAKQVGRHNYGIKLIPQIAVLYSQKGLFSHKKRLFSRWEDVIADDAVGCTLALLDAGESVEVVFSHTLKNRMGEFPLVVVPNWIEIEDDVKAMLVDYVAGGGRLMLMGSNAANIFADELNINVVGRTDENMFIRFNDYFIGVNGTKCITDCEASLFDFYSNYLDGEKLFPAVIVKPYKKGKVVALPYDFGVSYRKNQSAKTLDMLRKTLDMCGYKPIVRVDASYKADVAVGINKGSFTVNILNTSGDHNNLTVREFSYIPPLYSVPVSVDLALLSKHVPVNSGKVSVTDIEGNIFPVKTDGDTLTVMVDKIEIQKTLIFTFA